MAVLKRRWVVKAGSQLIVSGGPLLIRAWMQQVRALRQQFGIEVVWVTSGAIATASQRTGFQKPKPKRSLAEKQALSALGQPLVMDLYNLALHAEGLLGAQVLLTYDDLADSKRLGYFKATLKQLLSWGAVPVLNENDAVSNEEIRFGDNDSLSAKVAHHLQAERLIILTDVEGLYEKDPKRYFDAELVHELEGVSEKWLSQVPRQAGSQSGTGGMYSKLKAASEATLNGIETWLVKGDAPSVLIQVAEEACVGTRIRRSAPRSRRGSQSRKQGRASS
jgi:glutamate 5-kinase